MRKNRIEELIRNQFQSIQNLEIEDESHNHSGRVGMESHFKVLIVSDEFSGQSRVQRQRILNGLLKDEFEQGLHALTMRLLTSEEYQAQVSQFQSPNCQSKN